MTSEVLILNKRAIVLGADSAVTTSGGEHPRYSKTANKIFELSRNGAVAAAIYGSAQIDTLPWEVALKLFRSQFADAALSRVSDYSAALIAFLSANERLFPSDLRSGFVDNQFDLAIKEVIRNASGEAPGLLDESVSVGEKRALWKVEVARIRGFLVARGVASSLTQAPMEQLLLGIEPWVARAQKQLDEVPSFAWVDATDLAELGHRLRYACPDAILGSSGLVVAGYGEDQIFPAYEQLRLYGHVGDELYFETAKSFQITHTNGSAAILPLAQTSMIDMFTDGFSSSLASIIDVQGRTAIGGIFDSLAAKGIVVPRDIADEVANQCHGDFQLEWRRANWEQNFHPLIGVLQTLSVQEMAHLAESLLGLESLKERVTSPSESVGGPIDVAAITKSEGLVWIKRKHYFDASLNARYAARLQRSFG